VSDLSAARDAWLYSTGGSPQQSQQREQQPCPVSSQTLEDYLRSKRSPMVGQGLTLFAAGRRYDVDPRFIVALAGAETSFGRNITRGQYNAWNWFYRGSSQRDHSFGSWAEGIDRVTKGIAGPLYFRDSPPRTDATSIYSRYCQGPDCGNGLRNLKTFLKEQGGDPNSLRFPCPRSSP
jgi:hypothetical protein